jgi:hypothetical protein
MVLVIAPRYEFAGLHTASAPEMISISSLVIIA